MSDPASLHTPVLLAEVIDALRPVAGARMLDCTLGLGGHALALAERGAAIVGVDRDGQARPLAHERFVRAGLGDRLTVIASTFADAVEDLVQRGEHFDGVLADLGVSSLQLDDETRGFSWRSTSAPDMRMGDGCPETALELIGRLDDEELAGVLWRYGEERLSRRIARRLKTAHATGQLVSAAAIAEVVRAAVPGHHQRHPALRTFQALRIAVNGELDQLVRLLEVLPQVLRPNGRAAVISFHSLEDRAVKQSFREGVAVELWSEISRRVITAGEAELSANPRSAPAKLRWAQRADSVAAAPSRPLPPPIPLLP